ncbi:uncharacterized protein BDR25DRAFT_300465 [Lindgomyces ingoldianus]|uniref:Uncharacterized protein n=1 Tax=Lindgomyces ingoldianus TaxID=673940 RepID=A0ACB6RAY0_9PLEO|nr:uncharacterized protein BDR25DRAFT_300465 [Lindgomyces ingoldianus]KAF2476478.1 hypothetical protein BDR25DRAFT_300465 [Lindgomyces ingoldianus]
MTYLRHSRNPVNLGNLYIVPQLRIVNPVANLVNLGGLYSQKRFSKHPGAWAYLKDGSVYIRLSKHLKHDALETELRLIHCFLHNLTQPCQTSNEEPGRHRSIVIGLHV